MRHAGPKQMERSVDRRNGKFFIDITESFTEITLGGKSFAMIFIDDCSCFKVVAFLEHKNETVAVLGDNINMDIASTISRSAPSAQTR